MFKRVLVLCQGNICRSPVAAAMLQQRLPQLEVRSAGLGALVGHGADATAAELASANGLDLSEHQAQQVNEALLRWADLVLVMSQRQRVAVGEMAPQSMGKTLLLGRWLSAAGQDIPDPYRKSREAFEHVHRLLAQATEGWVGRLG